MFCRLWKSLIFFASKAIYLTENKFQAISPVWQFKSHFSSLTFVQTICVWSLCAQHRVTKDFVRVCSQNWSHPTLALCSGTSLDLQWLKLPWILCCVAQAVSTVGFRGLPTTLGGCFGLSSSKSYKREKLTPCGLLLQTFSQEILTKLFIHSQCPCVFFLSCPEVIVVTDGKFEAYRIF